MVVRLAYALVEHGAAGRPGRGRDWAEEGPDLRVDRDGINDYHREEIPGTSHRPGDSPPCWLLWD
jgi:hypothetical protein